MGFHAVNADDVELKKSARGFTKLLKAGGGRSAPTIQIRHWGPETDIPVHHHPFNEMFYVLEGEVEIGDTVYGEGSCIFIDEGTDYGPTRAPKGVTVLRYAEGPSK